MANYNVGMLRQLMLLEKRRSRQGKWTSGVGIGHEEAQAILRVLEEAKYAVNTGMLDDLATALEEFDFGHTDPYFDKLKDCEECFGMGRITTPKFRICLPCEGTGVVEKNGNN